MMVEVVVVMVEMVAKMHKLAGIEGVPPPPSSLGTRQR